MYASIRDLQQRRRDIITVQRILKIMTPATGLLEVARSAKRSFSSYESKKK